MIATNVLTTPGAPSFHAILEIISEASTSTEHHGRIELYWAAPTSYSLKLETPEFGQILIVSGDKVQETDRGDFYPGWAQDFVSALLDPMARAKDLRGHPNTYGDFPAAAYYCIKRDDRRNGITDDLTFAQVCYHKPLGTDLSYTLDFTHYLSLENLSSFHEKSIARTYHVSTRDDTNLQGILTTLEDWKPDSLRPSTSRSRWDISSSRFWWTECHDRWRCLLSFTSPQLLVSLSLSWTTPRRIS